MEYQSLIRARDLTAYGIMPKDNAIERAPQQPDTTSQTSGGALAASEAQAQVLHSEAATTLAHFSKEAHDIEDIINSKDMGKHVHVCGWNINCPHFIKQSWLPLPQFPDGFHEDYRTPQGRPHAQQHPNAFTTPFKSILTGEPFGPRSFQVIDNSRMPSAAHECHPHLTMDQYESKDDLSPTKPFSRKQNVQPTSEIQTTTIEGLGECTYQDFKCVPTQTANADSDRGLGGQTSTKPTARPNPESERQAKRQR